MDFRTGDLFEKIRDVADEAGRITMSAADAAGQKLSELTDGAKLKYQIYQLKSTQHSMFGRLGNLYYRYHKGDEQVKPMIEQLFSEIDEIQKKLDALHGLGGEAEQSEE